jgi:hypothetical protein
MIKQQADLLSCVTFDPLNFVSYSYTGQRNVIAGLKIADIMTQFTGKRKYKKKTLVFPKS